MNIHTREPRLESIHTSSLSQAMIKFYMPVLYFIALQIQECQWVPFAAVSVIEVASVEVLSPATHLQKVNREEVSTMFIKPRTIIDRCLLFSMNGTKYLAYYPNEIISQLDM